VLAGKRRERSHPGCAATEAARTKPSTLRCSESAARTKPYEPPIGKLARWPGSLSLTHHSMMLPRLGIPSRSHAGVGNRPSFAGP
jgi:hypothetical protein